MFVIEASGLAEVETPAKFKLSNSTKSANAAVSS